MYLILLVISAFLAVKTVNSSYRMLMKITDTNSMSTSIKKKLLQYTVVTFIYFFLILALLS